MFNNDLRSLKLSIIINVLTKSWKFIYGEYPGGEAEVRSMAMQKDSAPTHDPAMLCT